MTELVTLDRQHPEFMSYLMGTFAKDRRALPIQSLNVRTAHETVTFRILPVEKIRRPSWPVVWLKALRPRAFLQLLVPMFLILCSVQSRGRLLDPFLAWIACGGLVFLFASLLFANDVQDHVSGLDRLHAERGGRALQNGWLTAGTLLLASRVCLALAVLAGALVAFAVPATLLVMGPAALLGAWAFYRPYENFKDVAIGTLVLFLLAGPLLCLGLSVALTGTFDPWALIIGLVWGWLVLFPMNLRSLGQLVLEGRTASPKSLVGRLGFDRAVRLIQVWWILGVGGVVAFHLWIDSAFWFWAFLFLIVLSSVPFVRALKSLRSPAGSAVEDVRRRGELLFHLLVSLWILESLWRLSL